jgi:aminopeptidase 2
MADKEPVLLPTNVLPSHYDLTIDLNLETFVFNGSVDAQVRVTGGKSFQLHSLDLEFQENAVELSWFDGEVM